MMELWTDLEGAKAVWVDHDEGVAGVWYGGFYVILYEVGSGSVIEEVWIGWNSGDRPQEEDAWVAFLER